MIFLTVSATTVSDGVLSITHILSLSSILDSGILPHAWRAIGGSRALRLHSIIGCFVVKMKGAFAIRWYHKV